MKRVAITGPECTGKTTLAKQLAGHYHTAWVPEFAREYLGDLGRPYRYEDIELIARGQIALEDKIRPDAEDILFSDTCLLVCKVWSFDKFGRCEDWIERHIAEKPYDLYLLPHPNIAWESDGLREDGDRRDSLLDTYRTELAALNRKVAEVIATDESRLPAAIEAIEALL